MLFSKSIIVSGLSGYGKRAIIINKLLKKPLFYLMHGCVEYESKINEMNNAENAINLERSTLEEATRIICVSEKFSEWLKNRYPKYSHKITYLYNGIEKTR